LEACEEETLGSSKSIIGKKVIHSKFGIGKVSDIEEKDEKQYISIAFGRETKKFVYPDAFEHFLTWYVE
jgi:hypothetical protein